MRDRPELIRLDAAARRVVSREPMPHSPTLRRLLDRIGPHGRAWLRDALRGRPDALRVMVAVRVATGCGVRVARRVVREMARAEVTQK